ncbi:MAG: hypothetical protein J7647_07295 [Cyanobacteria bacterium SBLK]|nr:hypothetical protein [Cyanobacteria bacterium SBLK]
MRERTHSDRFRFQPHQIVYLEHQDRCLYAEVVQEIPERQMCWVRPLLLVIDARDPSPQVRDLRSASDLVWPIQAFSPALDTEIIPFLAVLESPPLESGEMTQIARSQLNQFIQQVWQKERE